MKFLLSVFISAFLLTNTQAQNYDESKVPSYQLPDALKTLAGKNVKTKNDWEKVRRPEIVKLFEDNIYGQMPTKFDSIRFHVLSKIPGAMNGRATLKEVLIQVFKEGKQVKINLTLFVPGQSSGPFPVFVLINNRGKDNTDPTRTKKSEFWPAEMVVDSGYAVAAFHVSDLAPDNKETFASELLQLYPEQLAAENGMRAIGAWAWGASRVMDYFEKDQDIDSKKVVVVGHSRGGKASLWASAQDERFAICVTNCSGNTGAALARRQFGERINKINETFPHWFAENYKKFNGKEAELPVDQHMLIDLIAPRPVYATNASKDLWADPKGTFLSLKNSESVYALYGIKLNIPSDPPAINQPAQWSRIGYHNREGEHDLTSYDWGNFIRFANIQFKKSK